MNEKLRQKRQSANGRIAVTIHPRKDGKWDLKWRTATGQRKGTTVTGTEEEALRRAQEIAEEAAEGTARVSLTSRDARILEAAKDAIRGSRVPVDQACREWAAATNALIGTGLTLSELVRRFAVRPQVMFSEARASLVERMKKQGRSPEYVYNLGNQLGLFEKVVNDRPLERITPQACEGWIFSATASKTQNNRRAALATVFRFALERDWLDKSPIAGLRKVTERRSVDFYPLDQLAAILDGLKPDLVPFVALQAFGCCRAFEIARMSWGEHVKLDQGIIRLSDDVTKTAAARIITIRPNLAEWLKPWENNVGRIYPGPVRSAYERARDALREDCRERLGNNYQLKRNGFRKSCATHLVPISENIGQAAEEMGHTIGMMRRNYRELVTKEEADTFFSCVPSNVRRLSYTCSRNTRNPDETQSRPNTRNATGNG